MQAEDKACGEQMERGERHWSHNVKAEERRCVGRWVRVGEQQLEEREGQQYVQQNEWFFAHMRWKYDGDDSKCDNHEELKCLVLINM